MISFHCEMTSNVINILILNALIYVYNTLEYSKHPGQTNVLIYTCYINILIPICYLAVSYPLMIYTKSTYLEEQLKMSFVQCSNFDETTNFGKKCQELLKMSIYKKSEDRSNKSIDIWLQN